MSPKSLKHLFLFALALALSTTASAKTHYKLRQAVSLTKKQNNKTADQSSQVRTVTNLDKDWQFTKGAYQLGANTSTVKWDNINLPHTWNKDDVMDNTPGYYRAACWYRKTLTLDKSYQHKKLYLYFNGANQETEVYINGQKAGSHVGGYTRFCFEIDQYIKFGSTNEIAVRVDNKFNESIPPLTADFTFFGGIYRDVTLIATNKTHFDLSNAANGVSITTPAVSAAQAAVKVTGAISGSGNKVQVVTTILDAAGKPVKQVKSGILSTAQFTQNIPQIDKPHLWTPENPYLYKVVSRLLDASGKVVDEVSNPLGFRWFKFDAEKGFFLNGKHYKLIGTNRHQDFEGMGNAIPVSYHVRDMELLKQMGGNFVRVSHYPQDPKILETCDRLGILASVEIPVVNTITETDAFTQTCKNMQVEMIRQNFNHPSVVIWAYMNEILLAPKFGNDKPRQQVYFDNVRKLAQTLDNLTRREDPSRYTMMSCHGSYNQYKSVGLVQIPMIIGWNLYQGWYGGKTSEFGPFLDKHHEEFPNQPIIVTEYGADADPRIRALEPVKFDKSVDYAVAFHQVYLKAIEDRPFVAGGAIWNLADFNSEGRSETMPHINSKGLLTWDRKPKDDYYFYQANLLKKSFVKISNWVARAGVADSLNKNVCTQSVLVFSNAAKVTLKLNGVDIGAKSPLQGVTSWNVPFKNGANKLVAVADDNGKAYNDAVTVNFNLIPADLNSLQNAEINVLLGAKRFYSANDGTLWIPAPAYKKGSFGYTGGEAYFMKGNSRQSYGTDRNILNSEDDPIYQTQQVGIQSFRLDVPAGRYELVLHFAELTTDKAKETLAYNLDNAQNKETSQERSFNVLVNNKPLLENFDAAKKYGSVTAGSEKTIVVVTGSTGITISFNPIVGQPILNALQLRKIKE